jgi:hypothetical protein
VAEVIRLILCLVLVPMAAWSDSASPPEVWAWHSAAPLGNLQWELWQGRAEIHRVGTSLEGRLFDETDTAFARYDIGGTVVGSRIVLRVTTNNSDAATQTFVGRYLRFCYDNHSGYEYALLSSGPRSIALFRRLSELSKCVPQ